jgi:hypothetical protein
MHAFRLPLLLLVLTSSCSTPAPSRVTPEPLRPSVAVLDFGDVWVSQGKTLQLELTNPNRLEVALEPSASEPFELLAVPGVIGAGETVAVGVRFVATTPGLATGLLVVAPGVTIELRANALVPPECAAAAPCRRVRFDFEVGRCVEELEPDDASCTSSSGCFATAVCRGGECVGTATTCDDRNPCTLDACDDRGCVHLDDSLSCPLPASPCRISICDADAGCGEADVTDGVACGPRDCTSALICLSGQCVSRPAPQTQACADVIAGFPAGPGDVDAQGPHARFNQVSSLLFGPDGTLYVADIDSRTLVGKGTLRAISPAGTVRTIATGFTAPRLVNVDARGNVVVLDSMANSARLRRVSPQGARSIVVGSGLSPFSDLQWSPGSRSWEGIDPSGTVRVSETGRVVKHVLVGPSLTRLVSLTPRRACTQRGEEVELTELSDGGALATVIHPDFCAGPERLGQRFEDGGFQPLAFVGPSGDGPIGSVGLADDTNTVPRAFTGDGGVVLYDEIRFNLRLASGGWLRTLAGPSPRQGLVDGPSGTSQLTLGPAALVSHGDETWFVDGTMLRVLRGEVVTTFADAGTEGVDVVAFGDGGLGWLDRLELRDVMTGSVLASTPGRFNSACAAADGLFLSASQVGTSALPAWWVTGSPALGTSAGVFSDSWRVRCTANDALVAAEVPMALRPRSALYVVERDGGLTSLDGGSAPQDFVELPNGDLVGIVMRSVVRIRREPYSQTTLMTLSEVPTAVAISSDGGVLVGIPHAILRVSLQ